jgi:AraC-like DNA-binding protein
MERRLGVGARLLSTTYEDVRQIAQTLGFTAQGFRRALLARFGVTPTEYRSRFWRGSRSTDESE